MMGNSRSRAHLIRGAIAACVVAPTIAGCGGNGGGGADSARDSALADSARASVDTTALATRTNLPTLAGGPGDGQQAGTVAGTAGGGACAAPPPGEKNPGVKGDPWNADDADSIDAYLGTLCFGYRDSEAIDTLFPGNEGPPPVPQLQLWIQTELRMHASDPDSLRNGWGMIVAKIRNQHSDSVQLPEWKENKKLPRFTDAYLWYGKNAQGQKYARVFAREREPSGRFTRLARGGTWDVDTTTKHAKARASWNPHEFDSVPRPLFQPPGSGWVACSRGCCTAINVNVKL